MISQSSLRSVRSVSRKPSAEHMEYVRGSSPNNDTCNVKRRTLYIPPPSIRTYLAKTSRSNSSVRLARPSPSTTTQMRGVDRRVSLPRERHLASACSSTSFSDDSLASSNTSYYSFMSIGCESPIAHSSSITSTVSPAIKQGLEAAAAVAAAVVASAATPPEVTRPNSRRTPSPPTTTTTTAPQPATKIMIEIAPGVEVALRGAEETQMAIDNGFYVECACVCCSTNINNSMYCILDCDYFLCPDCRSISPNPLAEADSSTNTANSSGGLGMGFRMEQ
jgi:hypothetical protein